MTRPISHADLAVPQFTPPGVPRYAAWVPLACGRPGHFSYLIEQAGRGAAAVPCSGRHSTNHADGYRDYTGAISAAHLAGYRLTGKTSLANRFFARKECMT